MQIFKRSSKVRGRSEASWRVYLVGHLVGPHGHLLHRHVCHVAAVLVGRSPRGAELDLLWPARDECMNANVDFSAQALHAERN